MARGYSAAQKSVPIKLARLLPYVTIGCCFDLHPRSGGAIQKLLFRWGTFGERNIGAA
jgi:hypothetical protein